jgi:hypothetical protein
MVKETYPEATAVSVGSTTQIWRRSLVMNEGIGRAQRTDDQTSDDEAGNKHYLDTSLDNIVSLPSHER